MKETDSYFIRNPDVRLEKKGDGGAILRHPDTEVVKKINGTGLFIWERCDGRHSYEEIIQELFRTREGVSEEEVLQDVKEFLDDLYVQGFIGAYDE
ncbi:MAG: PqqD family protein [Candidatus Aminicenantes bacterium]|nr:PqqD family protein [Candidatus Aminicenantes bacterium]